MSDDLKRYVRDIPDFPKPGILFRDLSPLFGNPIALRGAVSAMVAPFRFAEVDYVLGTEARGFILGVPAALELGVGFVPIRKPGKLPGEVIRAEYELEYGTDAVEMHSDAFSKGQRVLVVDDVIATGGTAAATVELARQAGAQIVGCSFLVELEALAGRKLLEPADVHSVLRY